MQVVLPHTTHSCRSFVDVLQYQSIKKTNEMAYRFLSTENESETITFGQLAQKAKAIATVLQQKGLILGDRAILIYPPGIDFLTGYFGCLYAGVIAVPVYPPLNNYLVEKIQRILLNSTAKILLTTDEIQKKLKQLKLLKKITEAPIVKHIAKHYWSKQIDLTKWDIEKIAWLTTDTISLSQAQAWHNMAITSDQLAFIQYTSGSTDHPKGVMLNHGNLLDNVSILHSVCQIDEQSKGVSWLPPYHDMGLIGGILLPLFSGFESIIMSPISFLQNPSKWLKALTQFHGTISAAPNFAFSYCVEKIKASDYAEIDLSRLKIIVNGSEPIRVETLERFYNTFKTCGLRHEVLTPSYGLAEATLYVSGTKFIDGYHYAFFSEEALKKHQVELVAESHPKAKILVSCGKPAQQIRIVDPKTHQLCHAGEIGEIWIHGASVAQGYWKQPEITEKIFHAKIKDDPVLLPYLRSGDLGFLYNSELYITGRIKDLIIIHGMNYYPQDIEHTVNHTHPLRSIAFSIDLNDTEKLVIVAELKINKEENYRQICAAIADAIMTQHELSVHSINLIASHTLPKTTSGKLRRRYTKELFESNQLSLLFNWTVAEDAPLQEILAPTTPIETTLCAMCSELIGRPIGCNEHFSELGVDSLLAMQLISRIRDQYDLELPIQSFYERTTISELAQLIEELQVKGNQDG